MNTTTFSKEQLAQLQLVLSQALKPIHQKLDEHTKILEVHTKLHGEHSKKLVKLEKTAALHAKKLTILEGVSKNILFKVTKAKVQLDILEDSLRYSVSKEEFQKLKDDLIGYFQMRDKEQARSNKRITVCEQLLGLNPA